MAASSRWPRPQRAWPACFAVPARCPAAHV